MEKSAKKRTWLPGVVLLSVTVLSLVFFAVTLIMTDMVPVHVLVLVLLMFALIAAAAGLLLWNDKLKARFVFGVVLSVLLSAVLVLGGIYLIETINALNAITNTRIQYSAVGAYVRVDDPAQDLSQTQGHRYGVLEGGIGAQEKDSTEHILQLVQEELETVPELTGYTHSAELVDALLSGQVDVMVLDAAYLELLVDIDKYKGLSSKIRMLDLIQVEQPSELMGATAPEEEVYTAKQRVYTLYISGSDTREGLNSVGRSDVNIIATVNLDTRQMLLVTTPRDYFVPLSISNGIPDKLTHAGIYGIDVSKDTLGMLYDTEIEYYFRLNFTGFEAIVDALGGVDLYNDMGFQAHNTIDHYFEEGNLHLNGAEALAFSRERYAFVDGDLQRGRNQMKMISAIMDKAMSPELLLNYSAVMAGIKDCFETNLPYSDIVALVKDQLSDNRHWQVLQYTVTGFHDSQIPYSLGAYAYVMQPNYEQVEQAADLMRRVREGETLTAADVPMN